MTRSSSRELAGIGIDFGTTNSVVALAYAGGEVESLVWPSAAGPVSTFRTALTFWRDGRAVQHVAGPEAIARAALMSATSGHQPAAAQQVAAMIPVLATAGGSGQPGSQGTWRRRGSHVVV